MIQIKHNNKFQKVEIDCHSSGQQFLQSLEFFLWDFT